MTQSDDTFILANRLKQLTIERGLTFKDLSAKSGVPLKTLYGWTAGNRPRNLEHLKTVAEALGVSLQELSFSSPAVAPQNAMPTLASAWIAQCRQQQPLSARDVAAQAGIRVDDLLSYEMAQDVPVMTLLKLATIYRLEESVVLNKISELFRGLRNS